MAEFTDVIPKEGCRTQSIQGKLAGALGVRTPGAGRQHAWGFTQGHWGALGPCRCRHPRERRWCIPVLIRALPGSAAYSGFYFPDHHLLL